MCYFNYLSKRLPFLQNRIGKQVNIKIYTLSVILVTVQVKHIFFLFPDHISLHAALGSLTNLTELNLTYQLRNIGIEYRKDQFQFTINDAKNLARGLEKCIQLKILRY